MTRACLVDTTRCIGCRGCQVACKQAHGLKAEKTKFAAEKGYQNPRKFSPNTRTYISYHELQNDSAEGDSGRLTWVFVKRQCMHCTEMRCAAVCAPQIFIRTADGAVIGNSDECIGCVACIDECPFGVPTIDFRPLGAPRMHKCTFCFERDQVQVEQLTVDGKRLTGESLSRHRQMLQSPACAKNCPTGALLFGDRKELLAEARRRIDADPDRYVDEVYGQRELGGLGWLYLASVPFSQLGFPTEFTPPAPLEGFGAVDRKGYRPS